jgi:hypothetical protein
MAAQDTNSSIREVSSEEPRGAIVGACAARDVRHKCRGRTVRPSVSSIIARWNLALR